MEKVFTVIKGFSFESIYPFFFVSKTISEEYEKSSTIIKWSSLEKVSKFVHKESLCPGQAWLNLEKAKESETRCLHSSTACPIFNELVK